MGVRLFVPKERLAGATVALAPDEIGYLVRVRRLTVGATLEVFDGQGGKVEATLLAGSEALALGARTVSARAGRFAFELWQGLAKGDKLELVVQKATELGVARIVPFASAHSVIKLSAERGERRAERLRKIAEEAARQCGRADVPEIGEPSTFAAFLAARQGVVRGVLYERETAQGLWPFLGRVADGACVALAIGPEGGFSPEEIASASTAGVATLGLAELGGRILRAETAAIGVCTLAALAAGLGRVEV